MIMRMINMKFLIVLISVVFISLGLLADAKDDAHARRKARKNSVVAIVKSGGASEGVNGYLIPSKDLGKKELEVVTAENKDRQIGYVAIAKEHKTSVEAISKAAGRINRKTDKR